jgi:hypothetical protein
MRYFIDENKGNDVTTNKDSGNQESEGNGKPVPSRLQVDLKLKESTVSGLPKFQWKL